MGGIQRLTGTSDNGLASQTPGSIPLIGRVPGTQPYNPTWYAANNIYLDPVAGVDTNSGTAIGSPVKTMAEVVRRYGSSTPRLTAGLVTINQLSAQTSGVDIFQFNPTIVGTNGFAWVATPTAVGGAFSPASVSARVQGNPGNDLTLNGVPAGVAAGQIVHNTTKNSWAMVIAVAAGPNARVTQPLANASVTTVSNAPTVTTDDTWAAGDSYQASSPLLCNWKAVEPTGGDESTGGAGTGVCWIQGVLFADPGPTGLTTIIPEGCACVVSLCQFNGALWADGSTSPLLQVLSSRVDVLGTVPNYLRFAAVAASVFINATTADEGATLSGNTVHQSDINVLGLNVTLGSNHVLANLKIGGGGWARVSTAAADGAVPVLWGAGSLEVGQSNALTGESGTLANTSGSTFANTLKLNSYFLNGVASGTKYAAGAWTDGVALTPANLDTDAGLQNPRTGSRIIIS